MVVLSSCSNRCVRDTITMADASVRDGLRVTQNMMSSSKLKDAHAQFNLSYFKQYCFQSTFIDVKFRRRIKKT